MELSVVYSRALAGIAAPLVQVETHLSNGLPAFNIVGLPETAVRESKDRVRSALLNSHFNFPDRRITVNLAPADLPKEGGRFDLPIALGILSASGQLPGDILLHHEFLGELALDGSLRPVPGVICAATAATASGRQLALSTASASMASRVPQSRIIGACDLLTLCAHLNKSATIMPAKASHTPHRHNYPDLSDVVGQPGARRALEIAASGAHNLLLWGPPGTGKTLLASRLPGILPPADPQETLTAMALRDVLHLSDTPNHPLQRPFRHPHHSASAAALVGGGARPMPGEVSLAHGGVLFLDELPEFNRQCLEVLREPMESGEITLSRSRHKVTYPARFQLVAAMNPCPCGYLGDTEQPCRCSGEQIQRYRARVSGPLLDRIDLAVHVTRVPAAELLCPERTGESSITVQGRVCHGRNIQLQRQGSPNAQLQIGHLFEHCQLGPDEKHFLETAANRLHLSGRGLYRTLKVARTIADIDTAAAVSVDHLGEALAYRSGAVHA